MTNSVVFTAPWDHRLTTLTILFSGILAGATVLVAWMALTRAPSAPLRVAMLASALIPALALVAGALLAPRDYEVGQGRLRIRRSIGSIEIPLSSIQDVGQLSVESLAGSTRTLGSGGLFGYYGRFQNRTLGNYRMYATRGEGYVLVRADHPYVLTPDSPEAFIEAVNRGRPAASGAQVR